MSQETIQVQSKRRKRRRGRRVPKERTIRVRYCYHIRKDITPLDWGSFSEMYEKYGDRFTYWCGDLPPIEHEGTWTGYRLDGDATHIKATLKRYGKHKAWIDTSFKYQGKAVILVYNAL